MYEVISTAPTVMRVAEMSWLFTLADHDFTHSLIQEVVLVGPPARLCHVVRHLARDLIFPAAALRVLDSFFPGVKVKLIHSFKNN
jgi:hypothetical protein